MEDTARAQRWRRSHSAYVCADGAELQVDEQGPFRHENPDRSHPDFHPPAEKRTRANGISFQNLGRLKGGWYRLTVSQTYFERDMETIAKCMGNLRTLVFPRTTRAVSEDAFRNAKQLRAVIANDGLEAFRVEYDENVNLFGLPQVTYIRIFRSYQVQIQYMFDYCENLIDIRLPEGLKTIGKHFFYKTGLKRIRIPSSVTEIADCAFYHCSSLTSIEFQNDSRLANIGFYAFSGSPVEELVCPASLKRIGGAAFCGCENLKHVELNEGLQEIGPLCFSGTQVTELRLPQGITQTPEALGVGCDYKNTLIVRPEAKTVYFDYPSSGEADAVVIHNGVKTLEEKAFQRCNHLRQIIFEEGSQLEVIGKFALFESGLREFIAPPSLKTIFDGAFCNCKVLERVVLNDGLEKLGADDRFSREKRVGVFQNSHIKEIQLPAALKIIEYSTFEGCKHLRILVLPMGLEKIGERSFYDSAIEQVEVPDNVVEIEREAFCRCATLRSVTFGTNSKLAKIGFGAFTRAGLEEFIAPPLLRVISQSTFFQCEHLKCVKLNENLSQVGTNKLTFDNKEQHGVFEESAIEDISLPSSLKRIEYSAFRNCANLKSISLPNKLEYLGSSCFRQSGLEHVVIPQKITKICEATFRKCSNLRSVTFERFNKLQKIGDYAFAETALEDFVTPTSLREVGAAAFCGCKYLTHVALNRRLEKVGWFCFSATPLKELALPKKVSHSGVNLGIGCHYKNIYILPDQLEQIQNTCWSIRDMDVVIVPAHVQRICENAFIGLTYLRRIVFPPDSQLQIIEAESFRNSWIEEITLPKSIVEIQAEAFYSCRNLKSVTFEKHSALRFVGKRAFARTLLKPEDVSFPASAKVSGAFDL